jgi:NAD(P)-dependent dehydrogenase (short-subunit alcohol dehydrogenase family)
LYLLPSVAICERLLSEWPNTYVILGSRDPERGQAAVKEIVQSVGGNSQERLECLALDTASDDSVRTAVQTLGSKFGEQSLYGIINNAGVCPPLI